MNILFCIFAFLFGSIPWGYLIGKLKGVDLRRVGSGNIGATNVLRTVGKKEALLTLILDLSKGTVPVLLFRAIYPNEESLFFAGMVGISSILGHCYSPWLKFRGGKGVATSLGVLLAYVPLAGVITIILWILTYKLSKISSLSALVSFTILPGVVIILGYPMEILSLIILITVIIYLRHRENISRLIQGKEQKIRIGNE